MQKRKKRFKVGRNLPAGEKMKSKPSQVKQFSPRFADRRGFSSRRDFAQVQRPANWPWNAETRLEIIAKRSGKLSRDQLSRFANLPANRQAPSNRLRRQLIVRTTYFFPLLLPTPSRGVEKFCNARMPRATVYLLGSWIFDKYLDILENNLEDEVIVERLVVERTERMDRAQI